VELVGMKLSVILPCYNGESTIALQLEALSQQAWSGDWEVIVVNNGSTDGSMEIVEQYRDRLPHLRIIEAYLDRSQPHLGVAHSYNVGVNASHGRAFAFCEADDEVMPGWVAAMGDALEQHDFVTGPLDYRPLNPEWLIASHGDGIQMDGPMNPQHPPYLPFAYGCNWGMRRAVYDTVGQFDETYKCAWDADYSWQVQYAGFKLKFIPHLVVHYRLRSTVQASYRQGKNWGEEYILLLKRHHSPIGRLALLRQVIKVFTSLRSRPDQADRGAYALWGFFLGWSLGEMRGLLKYQIFGFWYRNAKPSVDRAVVTSRSKASVEV
jgi:glycosyltransferase involved in cell wall biosynthesis